MNRLEYGNNTENNHRVYIYGSLSGVDNKYYTKNFGCQLDTLRALGNTHFKKYYFSQKHRVITKKDIKAFIDYVKPKFFILEYIDKRDSNTYYHHTVEALYID
jgi:hypothetical protein